MNTAIYVVCYVAVLGIAALAMYRLWRESDARNEEDRLMLQWELEYPNEYFKPVGNGGHTFRESKMYARHMVRKGRALHDKHIQDFEAYGESLVNGEIIIGSGDGDTFVAPIIRTH